MLDTKTMLVLLALGNLILFFNLCFFVRWGRNTPGGTYWYWSKLLQACGWLLLFLRGSIPFGVSFLAGNIFLLSGFWLESAALRIQGGAAEQKGLIKWGLAAIAMLLTYLFLDKIGPAVSVATVSLVSSVVYAYAGYELLKGWSKASRLRRFLSVMTIGISWLVLFRVVAAILMPFGLLANNPYQMMVFMAWYVLMLTTGFGFILMAKEESDKLVLQMTVTDPLTKILNRRGFEEVLQRSSGMVNHKGQSFSLLLMDVDYFKEINDQYGHAAGDVVLETVAKLCRGLLRQEDWIGRWGGDEFAVLLRDADEGRAAQVAERILQAIREHYTNETDFKTAVTISIGAATWRCGESYAMLLARADRALYKAKAEGRNCVEFDFDAYCEISC